MTTFSRNWLISYQDERCSTCGTIWAIELEKIGTCPRCAVTQRQEKYNYILRLEKQVASLKGQITKLKKRT